MSTCTCMMMMLLPLLLLLLLLLLPLLQEGPIADLEPPYVVRITRENRREFV